MRLPIVISNFVHISYRFRDITPPPLQEPIRISNETYAAKTRGMGVLHDEKKQKIS